MKHKVNRENSNFWLLKRQFFSIVIKNKYIKLYIHFTSSNFNLLTNNLKYRLISLFKKLNTKLQFFIFEKLYKNSSFFYKQIVIHRFWNFSFLASNHLYFALDSVYLSYSAAQNKSKLSIFRWIYKTHKQTSFRRMQQWRLFGGRPRSCRLHKCMHCNLAKRKLFAGMQYAEFSGLIYFGISKYSNYGLWDTGG